MALQEASIEREGRVHKVSLLQMDNAVLAFCYDGTMKLGTLAVSTPGLTEGVVGTSSVLLGGKYLIAARALAERSAAILGEILGFLPDINHHQNDQWLIVNGNFDVTEKTVTIRPRFFNRVGNRSQVGRRVASSCDPTF